MRWLVKDRIQREAIKALFGKTELQYINTLPDNCAEVTLTVPCGTLPPLTARIELEAEHELEVGWHPYPDEKPASPGIYLVAALTAKQHEVNTAWFSGTEFPHCDSLIFAWQEMPEIWSKV